jgi:hypothetical protein
MAQFYTIIFEELPTCRNIVKQVLDLYIGPLGTRVRVLGYNATAF